MEGYKYIITYDNDTDVEKPWVLRIAVGEENEKTIFVKTFSSLIEVSRTIRMNEQHYRKMIFGEQEEE